MGDTDGATGSEQGALGADFPGGGYGAGLPYPLPNPQQTEQLRKFWQTQMQEVQQVGTDPAEFKNQQLPLARIKKIMKSDEDVRMISAEAPVLFARACEMFILELTLRAWSHAEENKRRTLQRNDIAAAITRTDVFDFLVDIVPREAGLDADPAGGAALPASPTAAAAAGAAPATVPQGPSITGPSIPGPSIGGPSLGGPSLGGPSLVGPSAGPSLGGPSLGGPSLGGPSLMWPGAPPQGPEGMGTVQLDPNLVQFYLNQQQQQQQAQQQQQQQQQQAALQEGQGGPGPVTGDLQGANGHEQKNES